MKILEGNTIIKKIILILLVIIMLNNFIMPNYVRADDIVQKLIKGFFGLLAKLGDVILQLMQKMMVGPYEITAIDGNYEILYSPGIIFSDTVAALKVDFIGQDQKITEYSWTGGGIRTEAQLRKILKDAKNKNTKRESYINFTAATTIVNAVFDEIYNSDKNADLNAEIADIYDTWGWDLMVTEEGECKTAYKELWDNRFAFLSNWDNYVNNTGHYAYVFNNAFTNIGLDMKEFLSGSDAAKSWIRNNLTWEIESQDGKEGDIKYYGRYASNPWSHASESDSLLYDDAWDQTSDINPLDRAVNGTYVYEGGFVEEEDYDYRTFIYMWNNHIYEVNFRQYDPTLSSNWCVGYIDYWSLDGVETTDVVVPYSKTNTDYALRPQISKWYNALRIVALVGLLSVLVYVGIRIILSSSSAQDKAKYKNMLKDWLVAICILYMLHYIMAFMLQFNKSLNEIFIGSALEINEDGILKDNLMAEIRNQIKDIENISGGEAAGYTIMWLVVVILTLTFTFQYFKRVVYMAFLTMVAPMIALTYPLDKIKDGKAQAFSFWLKEYIFQCLIQPVHLLLYSMLIGSSIDFAKENMIYALVTLGFLVPAEKLIKQMFGMKSETSSGNFSAAMGGAAVMNMMNKLRGAGPKGGAEGAGASGGGTGGNQAGKSTPRTQGGPTQFADQNDPGFDGSRGWVTTENGVQSIEENERQQNGGAPNRTVETGAPTSDTSSQAGASGTTNATNSRGSAGQGSSNSGGSKKRGRRVARGLGQMGKRAITGPKGLRYRGRKMTGAIAGALGATIGVAATIASGDESKLFQNMAIGYGAGDAIGQKAADIGYGLKDKVTEKAQDYGNAFQKGYMPKNLDEFKSEMLGKEYGGIRITEDNVEQIFNRLQELSNNGAEF